MANSEVKKYFHAESKKRGTLQRAFRGILRYPELTLLP